MKFSFGPGTRPLDGYTIQRAIHRGGFGEVYYAVSDAGKDVALKLLHSNLEVELRGVAQCLNLKHPNLISIFDVRRDPEGDQWVVMEYVDGQTLADRLDQFPQGLPLHEVLQWLDGIAEGLAYLHEQDVVHRDLKPANIFSDRGQVKIGDVGLSKLIADRSRSEQTQSVGTVHYMAPEVARGRYGRHVDLYAMGVLLCQMLTGQVPFDGESTAEILMKHLTDEPDTAAMPEPFRALLRSLLEKDPRRRAGDIRAVRDEFRTLCRGCERTRSVAEAASKQPAPVSSEQPRETTGHSTAVAGPPALPGQQTIGQLTLLQRWQRLPGWWRAGLALMVALLLLELRLLTVRVGLLCIAGWGLWRAGSQILQRQSPADSRVSSGEFPVPGGLRGKSVATTGVSAPALQPARRLYLTPATVRRIPMSQRIQQTLLCGILSMTYSAGFVGVLYLLGADRSESRIPGPAEALFAGTYLWLSAMAVMMPVRITEGRGLSGFERRLSSGVVGLAVGLLAAGLAEFLMLQDWSLLTISSEGLLGWTNPESSRLLVVSSRQTPSVSGFAAFSCLLMVARSWWRQADSFRRVRLRIVSVLFSMVVGMLVCIAIPFPLTLGMMLAMALSVVVQLSSSWTPPEHRILTEQPVQH